MATLITNHKLGRMKKLLFIILILLCITRELKAQYTWFQSYPTAIEVPTIQLLTFGVSNALNPYCKGYATGTISYSGIITERGFVINTTGNPTVSDTKMIASGSGEGSFASQPDFAASTTYYCKAYALYGSGTYIYSNQISYRSHSGQTVATSGNSTPSCESASCSFYVYGTITAHENIPYTNGFQWGETSSVINYQAVNTSSTSLSYYFSFANNRTIYYQAAAYDPCDGWVYGSVQSVYLPSGCTIPTVTTASITGITANTATSGGNVTNDGGCAVTAKGVQWSIYSDFSTIAGSTSNGTGTGSFASSLASMNAGTTYYARAYAVNSTGTGYGGTVSFTTLCVSPTISLATISGITSTTANTALTITNNGGCTVLVSSIQWSVNSDFTGSVSSGPNTTGSYTITGLSPNTTYYVRGYAANNTGDTYTATQSFTTSVSCTLPMFFAASCTNVTANSIEVTGSISSDGGCAVTSRGIQYSTDSSFGTILGNWTAPSGGVGSYGTTITGLTCGTTYYFRPWATNSVGTYYFGGYADCATSTNNYPQIPLYYAIDGSTCGFTGNFTYTLALAQEACQDFKDVQNGLCSIQSYQGYTPRGQSLSIGTQLYVYNSCDIYNGSGYYLYSPATSDRAIVHLINGVIQSITSCP